jgi:thiamine-monophosphate kinase
LKLGELGEFGLIDRISRKAHLSHSVRIGIGDDAAAIEPGAGLLTLVTTDMLVEGVHFDLDYSDPITLGRKSLAVNLSDIAAMGGVPRHFLVSMAVPGETPVEFMDAFFEGMVSLGDDFGVSLIGGDTSSSPRGLVVSITVMGEQTPDLVVTRSGARPGDLIWVTGTLGDSALGLALLKKGTGEGGAVRRHLDPIPRVREGIRLAEGRLASAMIDISDGLLADLGHILELSRVGARICLGRLPLSDDFLAKRDLAGEDLFSLPLGGGEDYELLFASSPENTSAIQTAMAETGTACTTIGEITSLPGLSIVAENGEEYLPEKQGYNHFLK